MTSIDSHISSRQIARTAELTGSPEAPIICNVDPTDPIQLRRALAHVPILVAFHQSEVTTAALHVLN